MQKERETEKGGKKLRQKGKQKETVREECILLIKVLWKLYLEFYHLM